MSALPLRRSWTHHGFISTLDSIITLRPWADTPAVHARPACHLRVVPDQARDANWGRSVHLFFDQAGVEI